MTTLVKLIGAIVRLCLALLGLLTLVGGGMKMFEYGEGLADLSRVEIAFLLIWAGLEWRCLKRVKAARLTVLGCLISQLAWIAGLDLSSAVYAALRGTHASPVWQMVSVLAAVYLVTPKLVVNTVSAENPA